MSHTLKGGVNKYSKMCLYKSLKRAGIKSEHDCDVQVLGNLELEAEGPQSNCEYQLLKSK
jgi:hypothetical protein